VSASSGFGDRSGPPDLAHAALRYVRFARLLTAQLPGTFAAPAAGRISEWRASPVTRETAWLSPADRAAVDR
jgi:hypothetical protein